MRVQIASSIFSGESTNFLDKAWGNEEVKFIDQSLNERNHFQNVPGTFGIQKNSKCSNRRQPKLLSGVSPISLVNEDR